LDHVKSKRKIRLHAFTFFWFVKSNPCPFLFSKRAQNRSDLNTNNAQVEEEDETAIAINNTDELLATTTTTTTAVSIPMSLLKENNATLHVEQHPCQNHSESDNRTSRSRPSSSATAAATMSTRILNKLTKANSITTHNFQQQQNASNRRPRLKELRNTPYSVSLSSTATMINNCIMNRNLTMPMNPNSKMNSGVSSGSGSTNTRWTSFPSSELSCSKNASLNLKSSTNTDSKASSNPADLYSRQQQQQQQQMLNIKRFSSIRYPNIRSSRASLISRIRRFSENPNNSTAANSTMLAGSARHNSTNQSTLSDLTNCSEYNTAGNNVSMIRRHTSRRLKHSKTAKVLGFATLAFAITWAPYWLFQFGVLGLKPLRVRELGNSAQALESIALKLLKNSFYLNYMLNPLFYSFVNKRFRHNLLSILKKCGKLIVHSYYFVMYICYCMCCWASCCACCISRSGRCYNWNNLLVYRFDSYSFDRIWPSKLSFNNNGQPRSASSTSQQQQRQRKDNTTNGRRRSRLASTRSDLTNESVVYEGGAVSSISNSSVLNFKESLCEFFSRGRGAAAKLINCCPATAAPDYSTSPPETDKS
jgi:hypothetical protein